MEAFSSSTKFSQYKLPSLFSPSQIDSWEFSVATVRFATVPMAPCAWIRRRWGVSVFTLHSARATGPGTIHLFSNPRVDGR